MNKPEPVSACWRSEDARAIFVTEALEGNDAVFLATHSPILGFDVGGRDAAEFLGNDEQTALDVLSDPSRKHAFCVVQGEPGSGKSHLIRWLSVNWPNNQDIRLLLRRADGSLEGALRQLKDRLPEEFSALFDNLGRVQRATPRGRANIFLSTLVNTLEPGHFDEALEDDEWCQTHRPDEILGSPMVKEHWEAPARILNLLDGAGGERNSATASFNLFDIEQLAKVPAPRGTLSNMRNASQLYTRLRREAEAIEEYRNQGWLPEELSQEHPEKFKNSLMFMDALNRRRNEAIQNVLGVSAQALKTLFRQVREALAERGQRLVLLLEDITSWEGLDDSLIDVLVFNASARGDEGRGVCPLVSVVGVTPAYYEKLAGNYRQRITHELRLGQETEGLQDVASLRESKARRQFAARYLAAVRSGQEELERWATERVDDGEVAPPNRCDTCPRQEQCFATFGSEDGIGLFPFTARAMDRFFDALKDNDNGQTWKTPRGILQAILNPNLSQAAVLQSGSYPTPAIEPDAFRQDRTSGFALSRRLEQIVENKFSDPSEATRTKRVITYWGDPEKAETTRENDLLEFAGVSRSVFNAFGLEWIGDEASVVAIPSERADLTRQQSNATDQPTPVELVEQGSDTDGFGLPSPTGDQHAIGSATPDESGPAVTPASPRTPPKPRRLTQSKTRLEALREDIRTWANDGTVANANEWNKLLYELLQQLEPRRLGYPKPLINRVITAEMVKLEGTSNRRMDYMELRAVPWLTNGLESYLEFRTRPELAASDADFHRRNIANLIRGLEREARNYLERRVPRLEEHDAWSPVTTFGQVLLARAWLRGAIRWDTPVVKQMNVLLSDEDDTDADIKARSAPWQDWLNATNRAHGQLRAELRDMVSLGQGEGQKGSMLMDASQLVGALLRFSRTARIDPVPDHDGGLPPLYGRARELAENWNVKRLQIDRTESSQIKNRSDQLSALLRKRSAKAHFERLDGFITGIAELLPTSVPDLVQNWNRDYALFEPRLAEGRAEPVERLIFDLETNDPPEDLAERLCWLASAPARQLEQLRSLGTSGEKVLLELCNHARDCVKEASGTASLDDVRETGVQIQQAAEAKFSWGDR